MTSPTDPKQKTDFFQVVWHRVRFGWLLARWRLRVQWLRLTATFWRNSGALRRAFIALFAVGLGLLAVRFGAGHVSKVTLTTYLVATASMIGGTTAIIFSITIFLLQGVSDLYSSKHFDEYTNNWRDLQVIYGTIIAITICFFAAALYLDSLVSIITFAPACVVISLALVGGVFALIDRQYELVRRKIRPPEIVAFLKTKGVGFVKQTERNANRIAEILSFPEQGLTSEGALAVAYNRLLGPAIQDLSHQIEMLIDIAVRLSERQEVETAKTALMAAGELISAYLTARRTSSIAIPSVVEFLAIESDSQPFLEAHFGQLNRAGEKFVAQGQQNLAAQVVFVYRTVADAAKDVRHIGETLDNPILEQTMWSLKSYAESGDPEPDLEVLFQGVQVLAEIGMMSAQRGFSIILLGVQENLSKLGLASLRLGTTVVVNASTTGHLSIISAVFGSDRIDRTTPVECALEGIYEITVIMQGLIDANGGHADYQTTTACQRAYVEFPALLHSLVEQFVSMPAGPAKKRYVEDLLALFEDMRKTFRKLAKVVRADSLLAGTVDRLILEMNETLIDLLQRTDVAHVREELHKNVRWLLYSPYWFLSEGPKFNTDDNSIRTASEVIARTGILAWKTLHDEAIVHEAIKAIDAMATKALEKGTDGHGYAEPRILEMACYLGVLAMKSDWGDVVGDLKSRIAKFDSAFFQKYLSNLTGMPEGFDPRNHAIAGIPHHDELRREVQKWASDFDHGKYNAPRLGDAEDLMYDLIDKADIDALIQRIWGN
jgi:hypothetical protein